MSDSRSYDIANAIVTRVAAITAGGSYNFDAGHVKLGGRLPEQAEGTKGHFFVVKVKTDEREHKEFSDGPDAIHAECEIHGIAYYFSTDPFRDILKWCADIVRAIEATPMVLGLSYVNSLIVSTVDPVGTDPAVQTEIGQADIVVRVSYRMARGEV